MLSSVYTLCDGTGTQIKDLRKASRQNFKTQLGKGKSCIQLEHVALVFLAKEKGQLNCTCSMAYTGTVSIIIGSKSN